MNEIKICPICNKEYKIIPGYSAKRKFCYDNHYVKCKVCGKEFVASNEIALRVKNGGETTCSKECKYILDYKINGVYKKCIACGKEFRVNSSRNKICNDKHYKNCIICGKEFECNSIDVWTGRKDPVCADCHNDYIRMNRIKKSKINKNIEEIPSNIIDNKNQQTLPSIYDLSEFLSNNGIKNNIINNDIDIIGTNIIELDSTETHNIIYLDYPTAYNYHKFKTDIAEQNGNRCIHIFDWDIDNYKNLDLVNQNKIKLYARNCRIKDVSKEDINEFLNKYHLQNTCRYQNIRIGLYYKSELVQVMTFGKPRYNNQYQYELLRLCTKAGYKIVGGAERLFKYFIKNYNPESIISYCDRAKFTGDVYNRIGMKYLYTTDPRCHWSKGNKQITDNLLKQYGYDAIFKTNYGKGFDNKQLMVDNGWKPVYDCGQMVFEYKV